MGYLSPTLLPTLSYTVPVPVPAPEVPLKDRWQGPDPEYSNCWFEVIEQRTISMGDDRAPSNFGRYIFLSRPKPKVFTENVGCAPQRIVTSCSFLEFLSPVMWIWTSYLDGLPHGPSKAACYREEGSESCPAIHLFLTLTTVLPRDGLGPQPVLCAFHLVPVNAPMLLHFAMSPQTFSCWDSIKLVWQKLERMAMFELPNPLTHELLNL